MFPFHGYWRKTYFSENALLVNQATTSFEIESPAPAYMVHNRALDEVESALRGLGLTTEVQTFKYKKTPGGELYEGRNVHGIVHAPRSDHVEAIVVCTSLRTARGEPNDNGVALLTAFAEFAIRQNYWAKDVIILVTDSGEAGVEHWLKSYHGEQAEGTTTLKKRSGIIQAALGIELPPVVQEGSQEGGYESLGTYYLSNTGQLPNLDYVNVVTAVIKAQVAGSDVCLHIPFLKYKIDALTIGARPQPDLRGDDFNTDIIVIG
ncbi:Glycosyl phosphatidyl inositol protein transamidase complex subunit, partial [Spiromyces aspiralis]